MSRPRILFAAISLALVGCPSNPDPPPEPPRCVLEAGADPDFARQLGCQADFDTLASAPLDVSIPGASEYFEPTRRFVLGAVTFYEGPATWTWELSPYDTAGAELITQAYRRVRDASFFGDQF
jgi:hypothetical protein